LVCLLGLLPFLAGAAPPAPGSNAPDFQLKDLQGNLVRLSTLHGKTVVLHFWATWCPHCLAEMPLLESADHELAARGAQVLAINLGEPHKKVQRYAQEHDLNLTILLDSRGKAAQAFGVVGLPATVVIDPQGRVAGQIVTGIGFLGGGAIMRNRDTVHGMTTAATIWVNAAVGVAAGMGQYALATFAVALTLLVLVVLPPIEIYFERRAGWPDRHGPPER
jgi:peroxiredoxin